jgi:hypothetical protein
MQRNMSRRDFGKRLAGGAAFLVLQPASNYLAAAQSLRNDLKDLKGELYFDDAVLQSSADDFGHVVHKKPVAMLRLGTEFIPRARKPRCRGVCGSRARAAPSIRCHAPSACPND